MDFVNKATDLRLYIPKRKVKMNACSIWPFAQILDDFCYLDIWQCATYFIAALFKELALITIREMWCLQCRSRTSRSRSRLLWQSLGLVSKFEPGLGLRDCGLGYITELWMSLVMSWNSTAAYVCHLELCLLSKPAKLKKKIFHHPSQIGWAM